MTNILITGSYGQLGSELKNLEKRYSSETKMFFTDADSLDITNELQVADFCKDKQLSYIVNCAAYTAVDKAETDSENAFLINAEGPRVLASVALKNNIRLIHVSTDYVFDGKNHRPYREGDPENPESVYGHSKYEGEQNIIGIDPEYMIIRTSWLYSVYGQNFVKTMIRLGKERPEMNVVFDQVGSPTNAADLAFAITEIIRKCEMENHSFVKGIYHYSNEGVCSWYDFAKTIHEMIGLECAVYPIESKDYPVPAKRPFYSVLNKAKIKADYHLEIRHWKEALAECISILRDAEK